MKSRPAGVIGLMLILGFTGCARLFGWDIHAPGLLSEGFVTQIAPRRERVALFLSPEILQYQSTDRGGAFADPQIYHVGEAFSPMLLEALQGAFEEFIFLEVEPTPDILKRYGISHLLLVRIKDFRNQVTMRGQALSLVTETAVLDSNMNKVIQFESSGISDARAIFKKKGGPEVNLNAAIERNLLAMLQYLQDWLQAARQPPFSQPARADGGKDESGGQASSRAHDLKI